MSQQIHILQQFSLKIEKLNLNQIIVKIFTSQNHRYHLNKLLDFIFFFSTGCLLADDIQSGSLRLVLLLPMAEAFWELSSGFSSVCKSKSWENKINILNRSSILYSQMVCSNYAKILLPQYLNKKRHAKVQFFYSFP